MKTFTKTELTSEKEVKKPEPKADEQEGVELEDDPEDEDFQEE